MKIPGLNGLARQMVAKVAQIIIRYWAPHPSSVVTKALTCAVTCVMLSLPMHVGPPPRATVPFDARIQLQDVSAAAAATLSANYHEIGEMSQLELVHFAQE